MATDIVVPAILFVLMAVLHVLRQRELRTPTDFYSSDYEVGAASTFGTRDVQQDYYGVRQNQGVLLMLLADGAGANGEIAAKLAVDTYRDLFERTNAAKQPQYFFRRAANTANKNITNTLEERQGETSIAAAFVEDNKFYYTVVGNCRITVFRDGDLVPISEGHTLDVLARHGYTKGRISREKTLALLDHHRRYNSLGQDSFDEIEFVSTPLELRRDDLIVMMSEGVYSALRWVDIESALERGTSAQFLADKIIKLVDDLDTRDKDNATVLVYRQK